MRYEAQTLRVLSPSTLSVSIDLGLGVSVKKAVQIEGAREDFENADLENRAKHAMVVLTNKKLIYLDIDSRCPKAIIPACLHVPAKNPPAGMSLNVTGKTYLDVKAFMPLLEFHGYDVHNYLLSILNGR